MNDIAERVRRWDAVLQAVRDTLRRRGLREVVTPVRVAEVAIEPWIEPLRSEGALLITSPELAMKRLLAAGSGPCFQIAPVFRRAERGRWHREEFHLAEWYRLHGDAGGAYEDAREDVEQVVAAAFAALGRSVPRWQTLTFTEAFGETCSQTLPTSLDDARECLRSWTDDDVSPGWGSALSPPDALVDALRVWTTLFSEWSDRYWDPRVAALAAEGVAVHLTRFPPALAALSRIRDGGADRFESYVGGLELANGYDELGDASEQRRRFDTVNRMRESAGAAALPVPERFLAVLGQMPRAAGVALGVERLIALAAGDADLGAVDLSDPSAPDPRGEGSS